MGKSSKKYSSNNKGKYRYRKKYDIKNDTTVSSRLM